jgi:hypothetical protein
MEHTKKAAAPRLERSRVANEKVGDKRRLRNASDDARTGGQGTQELCGMFNSPGKPKSSPVKSLLLRLSSLVKRKMMTINRQTDDMEHMKKEVKTAVPRLERSRVSNETTQELRGMVNMKSTKCTHLM